MDNRRYQELRTYCMAELGESMSLPGYDAVMQVAVKAGGDTGRIKREEQLARSLFQCHDLTTRERAAAYLLAVITNHRIATWQREPSPPSGQESLPPLDKAQADELARVTRDAVTRYAAFLPDREAAVLLADCEAAPGPQTAPVELAGALLTGAQGSATNVVIQIDAEQVEPASPEVEKYRLLWRAVSFDENRVKASITRLERFSPTSISEEAIRDERSSALRAELAQIASRKDALGLQMGVAKRHAAERRFTVEEMSESRQPLDGDESVKRASEIELANEEIDALISERQAASVMDADNRTQAPASQALPVEAIGASGGTEKKWTPEKLAELRAYRDKYTMPETAAKFKISEQRIRQLLPTEKPKPKSYSVFTHHIK